MSCISVQWGAWASAGMASTDASTALRLERSGMRMIAVETGLTALASALRSVQPVVAAVPFIWDAFIKAARKPLSQVFAEYAPAETPYEQQPSATGVADIALSMESIVQEAVATILGVPVALSQPLMAAGLDSLGSVELRNSLEGSLGIQLPSTMVFDFPTISSMAEFLAQKVGGPAATSAAVAGGLAFASGMPAGQLVLAAHAPVVGSDIMLVGSVWRSPMSAFAFEAEVDAVGQVPFERWDAETDPLAARFGAFFQNVSAFDAAAFGVSETEAALMDPQHRLLLECVGELVVGLPLVPRHIPAKSRGIYVGKDLRSSFAPGKFAIEARQ
jgi:acyl carrier protein